MIHYTNRSPFSIRYPAGVSRYTVMNDRLHQKLRKAWGLGVETRGLEPDNFRSYFHYEKYGNVYMFYESDDFQRLEKKYRCLLRLDVARCFETIYTHSIAWSVHGKEYTKLGLHAKDRKSVV